MLEVTEAMKPDTRRRRSCHPLAGALVAAFLNAPLCWSTEMPHPEGVETSNGSRVVSPAVVATWITRREPRGLPELELLVFWRGTPGWFLREGPSGSSGSVSTGSGGGDQDRGVVVEQLSFGGIRLDLEFDQRNRTARIQEQEVKLASANVILVDDVDGADGPQVSSVRVDPLFPESPAEISAIVRRAPALYSFLRCDAKLPEPQMQPMFDSICAGMKPR